NERYCCWNIDNCTWDDRKFVSDGKALCTYHRSRFRFFPSPANAAKLMNRYMLNRTDIVCVMLERERKHEGVGAVTCQPCPAKPDNLRHLLMAHTRTHRQETWNVKVILHIKGKDGK